MSDHDAEVFCCALAAVGEIFERSLSDAAQTLYFDALKDLPLEAVLGALETAAKQNRFMPRPAELRELAGGGGDPELAVEAAWQTYRELARRVGGYASPTMDATLAATIIAVFDSWEQACWTDLAPEMWAARRKEFSRVYRLMLTRGEAHTSMTLDGFCARRNVERYGHPDPLHATLSGTPATKLLNPAPASDDVRDQWRENTRHAIAIHHERTH